jgi:hypothetical protein
VTCSTVNVVRPMGLVLATLGCGPRVATPEGDGEEASTQQLPPQDDGVDDDTPPPPDDSAADIDDSDTFSDDIPVDPATTGGDETGPPPEGDCIPFDPSRVYLHGTLSEGASYLDALADPTNPTDFCVGFRDNASAPRIRPTDQRVVFVEGTNPAAVFEFTPDVWVWNGSYVEYPEDPYGNDTVLVRSPCDGFTGLAYLRLHPQDGRPYSSCSGVWFDPDGLPVFASPSGTVVAVHPDGRLAVQEPQGFFLLAAEEIPGEPLAVPRDDAAIIAGRVHDEGLWLVASAYPQLYRWHLVDDVIVEEGEYSDSNTGNANVDLYSGAIDGNGDFFHIVFGLDGGFADAIVRRRLAPDTTEVIYSEAGLPDGQSVKIHVVGELFTGP